MTKRERVETLINYYADGNRTMFAKMLGITPQTLSNWMKRDTLDFELVHSKCKNLNGDWLLTGEGDITKREYVADLREVNTEMLSKEWRSNFAKIDNDEIHNKKHYSNIPYIIRVVDIRSRYLCSQFLL